VFDEFAISDAHHVHALYLVTSAAGGLGGSQGVSVDGGVTGLDVVLDRGGDVLETVVHVLPFVPPRVDPTMIARVAAPVVEHIGIDEGEPTR